MTFALVSILDRVHSQTAALLKKIVRNAVTLSVQRTAKVEAKVSMGSPLGYSQATEGCFANEALDFPTDLPLEFHESW